MKPKVKPTFIIAKSPKKPYTCSVCGNAFAWGKDSWQYGKPEYKTNSEEREIQKVFCSKKCMNEFEKGTLKYGILFNYGDFATIKKPLPGNRGIH